MTSPLNQIMNKLDEIDAARDKIPCDKFNADTGVKSPPKKPGSSVESGKNYVLADGLWSQEAIFIALSLNEIKSLTAALRAACFALEYYQGKLYHADKALEQIAEKLKVL